MYASIRGSIESIPGEIQTMREKMKDLAKTNTELGLFHVRSGNYNDAVFRFKMALRFNQNYAPAFYGFGLCRHNEGYEEEAESYFRKALTANPGFVEAQYMLFHYDHKVLPERTPVGVIRERFDNEAATYNETYVGHKDYVGHELVCAEVEKYYADKEVKPDFLDLGCGTGLCGKLLREKRLVGTLTGVDLSLAMLTEARSFVVNYKPVYTTLVDKDYMQYLKGCEEKFDGIIAASSFHYIKDISAVLTACKRVLKPEGMIIFLVAKSAAREVQFLIEHDTFSYSGAYLETAIQAAGLEKVTLSETLIYEGFAGYLVAVKTAA